MSLAGFRPRAGRFLVVLLAPFLMAQAPSGLTPQVFTQVQQALEADASGAPANKPIAFQGGLAGVVVFGAATPSPEGPCRGFTLSTPTAHYTGRACLSAATHLWRLAWFPTKLQMQALATIAKPEPAPAAPGPPPPLEHATLHPFVPPPQSEIVGSPPQPAASALPEAAIPAAAPPPPPAAQGVVEQASDEIERQIQAVQIEYNKPAAISFDGDTTIVLVAESHDTASGHAAVAAAPGQAAQASAQLGAIVTAQLKGDSDQVQITPLTSDTQAVTSLANTQWSWSVRAKQPGQTTLTLDVYDDVTLSGQNTLYQIKTYTNQFPVQISPLSSLKWQFEQIDPIWQALGIGTPVALIGGLIAWLRRPRKPAQSTAA